MVQVGGKVHLGRIVDGVCYAVCTAAHRGVILPVSNRDVDCQKCLWLMKDQGLRVNAFYELTIKRLK